MKLRTALAITLIAIYAVSARAGTENVYRCGSSYSQTPCPDATRVDVQDARTPEQKAQADAATRRDANTANAMEKVRLKEEARMQAEQAKAAAAAAKADKKHAAKAVKAQARAHHSKKKRKEPDYFTASGATPTKPKAPASQSQ